MLRQHTCSWGCQCEATQKSISEPAVKLCPRMMAAESLLAAGREKDGLWAVLAWLSILAYRSSGGAGKGNLGDKIAKFAPGALLASIRDAARHFALQPGVLPVEL